jgi:hypothetical protein
MSRLAEHWKATLGAAFLFLVGIGVGFAGSSGRERRTTTTLRVTTVLTAPPTQQGVYVDYGQYQRYVRLLGLQWIIEGASVGGGHVEGQAEYLGGLGCRVLRSLQVTGTLFDQTGKTVETLHLTVKRLPRRSHVPISITHKTVVESGRIELFVARAAC